MKTSCQKIGSSTFLAVSMIICSLSYASPFTAPSINGTSLPPTIAVGVSGDNNFLHNLPLAYTSSNRGVTWTLSSALPLPGIQTQGLLGGTVCRNSSNCNAVGESYDSSFNNTLPLAYTSTDGGNNWTLSSAFLLPSGHPQGELFGITCLGDICTTAGVSFDNSFNNNLPLVYTSSDGGNNWTPSSPLPLPIGQTQGGLLSVICTAGNICTAVGQSMDSGFNNRLPLVYTSIDGGVNWILSPTLALPSGQTQGYLNSIMCKDGICTAVGVSFNNSLTNRLPLAYTSIDGGVNWILSPTLSLPSGQTQGELSGVTCTACMCTSVGWSLDNSGNNRLPLTYTSSDGGKNWMLSSALSLPSGQVQGALSGIVCEGRICTTAGWSFDGSGNHNLPLAYTSSDWGINWTLSTALSLPSGQTQAELFGVGNKGSNPAYFNRHSFKKFVSTTHHSSN